MLYIQTLVDAPRRAVASMVARATHTNWFVSWEIVLSDGRVLPMDAVYSLPRDVLPKRLDALRRFLIEQSSDILRRADRNNRLSSDPDHALLSLSDEIADAEVAYVAVRSIYRV